MGYVCAPDDGEQNEIATAAFAQAAELHYSRIAAAFRRSIAGTTMTTGPCVPSQAESTTEIRIVNEMSEIEQVVELVASFGASHQVSNSVIVALKVSLDEVLNNIISYGYDDTRRHDIEVRLAVRSGGVEVIVEDDGKPFDPLAVATPRPRSQSEVGGVGLHFVRSLMDQLEYSRRDGVNRLRLVKKLENRPWTHRA